jgi:hypothetical protein
MAFQFSRQYFREHHPIAEEAEERISKSGRVIFFKEKMTDPRKSITQDRHQGQYPNVARERKNSE